MKQLKLNEVKPETLGYSQKGQDSLIKYVFDEIGHGGKYYVEFGARDGVLDSNTHYLRNHLQWNGVLIDCMFENPALNLYKRKLTKSNVTDVFAELTIPREFDFLNVDIDGNDYWLLKEILWKHTPRVIMVETNVRFSPETDLVQKYDDNWYWSGSGWYGCSPRAMMKMANYFHYTPVYIHLDDMILVRTKELVDKGYELPTWESVYPAPKISLYDSHRDNVFKPEMWMTP